MLLEVTAALAKLLPVIERQSQDAAIHARALYDLLPTIVNANRMHHSEMQALVEKFVVQQVHVVTEIRNYYVEIAKAVAIAANDAGDAKDAATAAAVASRESTGKHEMHHEQRTPEDQKGVAGAAVKGLGIWSKMSARSQVLLIILALVTAAVFGTQIGAFVQEKLNPKPEMPTRERRRDFSPVAPFSPMHKD